MSSINPKKISHQQNSKNVNNNNVDKAIDNVLKRIDQSKSNTSENFVCMELEFRIDVGVFSPNHFRSTKFFTEVLPYKAGEAFLEIGCGAGVTAITAAYRGCAPVVATDISVSAVANARANVVAHGLEERVSVRHGDLFQVLSSGERFDLIYWNSNFVCVPKSFVFREDIHHAFFDADYAAHQRFLANVGNFLNYRGKIILGFSSQGDLDALQIICAEYRYKVLPFVLLDDTNISGHCYKLLQLIRY